MSPDAAHTLQCADRQHSNHRSHAAPAHQFIWRSGIKLDMSISPDKRRNVQFASAQHVFMPRTGKWKRERKRENLHAAPTTQVYHSGVDLIRAHCHIQHCHNMLVFDFPGVSAQIHTAVHHGDSNAAFAFCISSIQPPPWSAPTLINTLNNKERWRVIKEMKGGLNINESEQGSGWQTQFDTDPSTLLKQNIQSHPIKTSQ